MCPAVREIFCSCLPPKTLFQNPSLFLVFCFPSFSCVFPFKIPCLLFFSFINPFSDNFLVLFLVLYLCCPFPFFICASFLQTNFLTSPSQIQLAFTFGYLVLLPSYLTQGSPAAVKLQKYCNFCNFRGAFPGTKSYDHGAGGICTTRSKLLQFLSRVALLQHRDLVSVGTRKHAPCTTNCEN